jgi:hypothetical protein
MFSSTLLTLLTSSTLALALPTGTSPSPLVRSELNLVRRNVKESDLSWIPGLNITYASPFNTYVSPLYRLRYRARQALDLALISLIFLSRDASR